ncbi:MurR/RpiR family transcriptional regulator [Anaerovibrio sp.]|uniref:MurR/RpiR family transcriptional regulator n=1 Tax=Anaerovibrio sp. TaxID=1872532 RepID=UPI003F159AD3
MAEAKIQLPILRSVYQDLTKSEQRIADYITNHADEIMDKTIPELARNTNSAEITISRFCKKLGFSGLQGLKIALAAELSSAGDVRFQEIQKDDSYEQVAGKVFGSISEGLQDTLKILDYDAVDRAIAVLSRARRVAVYGFGNSATVCRDIETRFLRFGMLVQAYDDVSQQLTSASLLTGEDAVIAVSHSGSTLNLLKTVEVAKKSGAQVIVITSYAQSNLAKLGDIVLTGMGREVHYRSESVASRLIHMAITDVLYTGIAMGQPEKYRDNISKMRSVISSTRE